MLAMIANSAVVRLLIPVVYSHELPVRYKGFIMERQFPFRWWEENHVNIALGADWPAAPGGFEEGVHPFNNTYSAVHRIAPAGKAETLGSKPGLELPPSEQVLTLAGALRPARWGAHVCWVLQTSSALSSLERKPN